MIRSIAAIALTFIAATNPAVASDRYVAFGASETQGASISPGQRYVDIVSRACGRKAVVYARPNYPSLLWTPVLHGTDVATWFVDINNSSLETSEAIPLMRTLVRELKKSRAGLIILMPPVRSIPGLQSLPPNLIERQALIERAVEAAANSKVHVVRLRLPKNPDAYLETDKLHPNSVGHREIGRLILRDFRLRIPTLNCDNELKDSISPG
jgi:hypothetical protein